MKNKRILQSLSILRSLDLPAPQKQQLLTSLSLKTEPFSPLKIADLHANPTSLSAPLLSLLEHPSLGLWISESLTGMTSLSPKHPFAPLPPNSLIAETTPLVAQAMGLTHLRIRNWPRSTLSYPQSVNIVQAEASLAWTKRPESLIIVGGGYIGCELAAAWGQLGISVTLLDAAPQLLPGFADATSDFVQQLLRSLSIAIHFDYRVSNISILPNGLQIDQMHCHKLILCTGAKTT